MAYLEAGSGPPLVLIHGVGLQAEVWAPQMEALSRHYRVIAADMPGHGDTACLAAGTKLPDFVLWARQLLDDLDLRQGSIVGHSMGALIALGLAIEAPERIRAIGLISGVHKRLPEASAAVRARAAQIESGERDVEGPLARWFGPQRDPNQAAARQATRAWLAAVDLRGYATAYRAFAEADGLYADRIGGLRCPALFVTGEEDPNSTPEMSRAMAQAAPDGRAVVVPGHRHMVALTAPEKVNAILADFLRTACPELAEGAE